MKKNLITDNEAKEFGRHHAFDIYSTWAMMTEEEFEQAEDFGDSTPMLG